MPFRWEDCLEGHFLIGMTFTLASLLLLTLTTFSTPFIKSIYFLESPSGLQLGSFGYCVPDRCRGTAVGYDIGAEVILWLTRTQILWGLAAGFLFLALVALVLSLIKIGKFTWNPIYFRTTALLGTLVGVFASIFRLVLWVTARHRFNTNPTDGRATYGAALWLGLAGTLLALIAACVGGPAYAGNYGMYWANRGVAYNV